MSLFRKAKTIYTSASVSDDMLILTRRTRTNASHSESRVMIDKISSITHSVIFGKTSTTLAIVGLVSLILGIILVVSAQLVIPMVIAMVGGAIFIMLAVLFREHSILVDCSGDCHDICVGRKNTATFYAQVCAVLKMKREGKQIGDMTLTENKE